MRKRIERGAVRASNAEAQIAYNKMSALDDLEYFQDYEIARTHIDENDAEILAWFDILFGVGKFDKAMPGGLYAVDIPEDDVMLRKDAKFSEQPETVQNALREVLDYFDSQGYSREDIFSPARTLALVIEDNEIGKEAYYAIADMTWTEQNKSEVPEDAAEQSSKLLNEYGVKGIR